MEDKIHGLIQESSEGVGEIPREPFQEEEEQKACRQKAKQKEIDSKEKS